MRGLGLLETPAVFFPNTWGIQRAKEGYDHIPFMNRGVPFVHVLPSPSSSSRRRAVNDDAKSLDLPTVRDWSKIMLGFTLEWLDMMEVWPE